MKVLLDGDIIVYRIGWTTEAEPEPIVRYRVDELISRIMETTGGTDLRCFLSDSTEHNFRTRIYPEYKAHRTQPKPEHYNYLREYLICDYGAKLVVGAEADDGIGIASNEGTIIASIDKDLDQIPGTHFNFVRNVIYDVLPGEAIHNFYKQLLTGDVSDNIRGVSGIGEKKATKLLAKTREPLHEDCFSQVLQAYEKWLKKEWEQWTEFEIKQMLNIILLNGRLLKIKRSEDEPLWSFPFIPPEMAQLYESIVSQDQENSPYTELIGAEKNGT